MDNRKPIARRSILALLGAAPFAAKHAATEAAAAADISVVGERKPSLVTSGRFGRGKIRKKLVHMLMRGEEIPTYKKDEWLRDAQSDARILDPDLASMRSLSLASKIRIQTDRNYRQQFENYIRGYKVEAAWEAFKGSLGKLGDDDDWDH